MSHNLLIDLYIQPGAAKPGLAGYYGERLKIKLRAPASENKANCELIEFLADKLGLAKKNIEIVYGLTSRLKTISLKTDLTQDAIYKKLG